MNIKQISLIVITSLLALFTFFFLFNRITNNEIIKEIPTPIDDRPITDTKCGIENCHGLDISCGPNVAEVCTTIYMAGDACRQFASCAIIDNECQLVTEPEFTICKNCVENCQKQFGEEADTFFECESQCLESVI